MSHTRLTLYFYFLIITHLIGFFIHSNTNTFTHMTAGFKDIYCFPYNKALATAIGCM